MYSILSGFFVQVATLFLVTGPWAAGKTSTARELIRGDPEYVAFDWDSLIPALSISIAKDVRRDSSTWPGLKAIWLSVASSVLDGGRDVVLFGPLTPDHISSDELPGVSIACAYLDCPDERVARRLGNRGATSEEIDDELQFLARLRASGFSRIDYLGRDPCQVAEMVAACANREVAGV